MTNFRRVCRPLWLELAPLPQLHRRILLPTFRWAAMRCTLSESPPQLTLIQGGGIFAPEPCGRADILIGGGQILKIGDIDRRALDNLEVDYEVIDAASRLVVP